MQYLDFQDILSSLAVRAPEFRLACSGQEQRLQGNIAHWKERIASITRININDLRFGVGQRAPNAPKLGVIHGRQVRNRADLSHAITWLITIRQKATVN